MRSRPRGLVRLRAVQKYFSELRPTVGTPPAARRAASSWSSPAQPPSPVSSSANSSDWPLACTSCSGRSPISAPGATGSGWAVRRHRPRGIAASSCARHREPWPTLGSRTMSPSATFAANTSAACGSQTWSCCPWKAIHGCFRLPAGSSTSSCCLLCCSAGRRRGTAPPRRSPARHRSRGSVHRRKSRAGTAPAWHTPRWRRRNNPPARAHVLGEADLLLQLVAQGLEVRRDHLTRRVATRGAPCPGWKVLADVHADHHRAQPGSARAMLITPSSQPPSPDRNIATLLGLPSGR